MTELNDVFQLLRDHNRIIITKDNKRIWFGYLGNLIGLSEFKPERQTLHDIGLDGHEKVQAIRPHLEYRHPEWIIKGLMAPLMPEETPEYAFRDLQETFYFEIVLV